MKGTPFSTEVSSLSSSSRLHSYVSRLGFSSSNSKLNAFFISLTPFPLLRYMIVDDHLWCISCPRRHKLDVDVPHRRTARCQGMGFNTDIQLDSGLQRTSNCNVAF